MTIQSRPARGAWIEITCYTVTRRKCESRPARGAWIEIPAGGWPRSPPPVAPRTGRVD